MCGSLRSVRVLLVLLLALLGLAGLALVTVRAGQSSAQRVPASVLSLPTPLLISGSPLRVLLGGDSSIQVYHDEWPDFGQVYGWTDGSADSGIWLWVDGEVYGPDFCFEDRIATAIYTARPWTMVSHSGPTGSGTASDPWVVTTVLDAGTSGVRVTQRVSYVDGQDYFRLQWDVANSSGSSKTVNLFHANDCYFADDRYGRGYYDAATGAVGAWNETNPWYMLFVPGMPGSAYQEGEFWEIWDAIGYCGDNETCPVSGPCVLGPGFNNTISANELGSDNGFGLQWERTIGPGGSATLSDWWTFGTTPNIPGEVTPTPPATPTPTDTPAPTPTQIQTPTPTATRTRTPTPTIGLPDLTVSSLEVNQAIQDASNSIPLIAYKRTVVRAYLDLVTSMPIGTVTGQLRGYRGATLLGTVAPFNPAGRITVVQRADWRQLNHTLNFELPFTWLAGDLRLEVEVNTDRAVPETNYANNTTSVNVSFVDGGELRIAWLPIHYVAAGYAGPADPSSRVAKGDGWLKAVYPVSQARVQYYPWPGITWGGDVNADTGGVKLLNYLNRLLQLSHTHLAPDHVYAWLPSGAYGGNGLAWLPGKAAFGNDTDDRWRRTLAHEVGHNRNVGHSDVTIGVHGFDVADRQVKEDTKLDFMVPGRLESEAWVAPQTYLDLYSRRMGAAADSAPSRQGTADEYLLVSGLINLDGSASFDAFYRQTLTDPPDNPPPGTAYCLELYDAAEARLADYCFDVSFDFGDSTMPMSVAPFALSLPFAPGTRLIVLKYGGAVVASRTVSEHAPVVTVSWPYGGVIKTVTWTAEDPDGDALSYSLLYSADNKSSWYAVATDLTQSVYALDTAQLPGGLNCYVRVLATDGVNTNEGEAGPFSIVDKPPVAVISAPAAGAVYEPGETVLFAGDGFDPEDGSLPDEALTWSSDRQGVLGTGRMLARDDLGQGKHIITLSVRDSARYTATDRITLYIGPPSQAVYLPVVVRRR